MNNQQNFIEETTFEQACEHVSNVLYAYIENVVQEEHSMTSEEYAQQYRDNAILLVNITEERFLRLARLDDMNDELADMFEINLYDCFMIFLDAKHVSRATKLEILHAIRAEFDESSYTNQSEEVLSAVNAALALA